MLETSKHSLAHHGRGANVLQVKFFLYFLCGHLQQWMVNVDKYFV